MQKAEAPHNHAQNQPAQRQGRGVSLESPQGEQIAQLETMVDVSPQAGKLAQLAATANNSPQATAQRWMMGMIHNSPRMAAQRKAISAIHNSPHVTAQRQQLGGPAGEAAQREAASAKPNNTGLPDNLKSGIESLSGISMDNVKVHYNSSQPAQLNALAYAQGTDIHVAPGQEQHLSHEAWHVVQQAQGRVQPTMQMKDGVPVNDDVGLELEADVMGERAASVGVAQGKSMDSAPIDSATRSAANEFSQKCSSGVQFQDPSAPPIQRLVVAGGDQDNLTIASALPAATGQAGGPVQDWAGADLTGANRVAVVAHGDIDTIFLGGNEYNGRELAQQLIAKHIQSGSTLLLWACRAGMQSMLHGVSVEGSSLVEQTGAALEESGRVDDVTVTGFRGIHMFLPGDNNASRIINPALTGGNPDTEATWLTATQSLNMHYVYLSGYFSDRYRAMYMEGWRQQDVVIPSGNTRNLWTIEEDVFADHASNQTRAEFMEKEGRAYHPPLVRPAWLADQDTFNEYKNNLWRAAGVDLTHDVDFDAATLRESEQTRAAMTRTRVAIDLD